MSASATASMYILHRLDPVVLAEPLSDAPKDAAETKLNRLFYRLGWTKGWYKGALRNKAFGQIGTPDMRVIKAKLLELARKYDGATRIAA